MPLLVLVPLPLSPAAAARAQLVTSFLSSFLPAMIINRFGMRSDIDSYNLGAPLSLFSF